MANTFELISSVTVGSGGAASIDFTSIPATYTDLCLKTSLRVTDASIGADINIKFNGLDTGKTVLYIQGVGTGTPASGFYSYTSVNANGSTATSNTFANGEIYLPNYSGSTNKSWSVDRVLENNATSAYAAILAGVWASTAAINQLTLIGNFVQYSTAYLYGVKNA